MTISALNSEQLHGAIISGCQEVIAQKEQLNSINVFPVADSDTGSNMASTAKAVMSYSSVKAFVNETLQSVAEASLLGARGNSGMIFSQFFNGLSEHVEPKEQLTLADFNKLLGQAAQSAHQAILSPLDGTMLTIMQTWANGFNQLTHYKTSFYDAFQSLLPSLKESVEQTTQTLEALRDTDLVDAGALGFYYFVQGFSKYLAKPDDIIKPLKSISEDLVINHEAIHSDTPLSYRYCTEAIIKSDDVNKESLKQFLAQHGDSIVLTGSDKMCRFHLHTDTPGLIFTSLMEQGTIEHPKVDDMLRQKEAAHHRKARIALVTDSSADIPSSLKDQHQIHVLPLNMSLGQHQLLDGYGFAANDFYRKLESLTSYPQTSLPSVGFIQEKLSYLSNHYDEVLVVSISQAMSGTYESILKASDSLKNVHVLNSRMSSASLGLLVCFAAELIAENKPIDNILSSLNKAIDETHLFVSLQQVDSMVRSGRISQLSGRLAKISGVKPIISIDSDGKGILYDKVFSSKKALTKLISLTKKQQSEGKRIYQYSIVHADAENKANELAALCTETFGKPPAYIEPVSAAIGLHAGSGSVALACMLTSDRE